MPSACIAITSIWLLRIRVLAGSRHAGQTGPVLLAMLGRDDQLRQLDSDRILARVAEGASGGIVPLDHAPGAVDADDAVQRRLGGCGAELLGGVDRGPARRGRDECTTRWETAVSRVAPPGTSVTCRPSRSDRRQDRDAHGDRRAGQDLDHVSLPSVASGDPGRRPSRQPRRCTGRRRARGTREGCRPGRCRGDLGDVRGVRHRHQKEPGGER